MTDAEILSCINELPTDYKLIKDRFDDFYDYRIAINDGTLLVTLGGTVGAMWPPSSDWLRDFEFWKNHKNMEVGFYAEAKTIIDDIRMILSMVTAKKMILSGFSKGGAHAAIIHDTFRSVIDVYSVTAGAPRALSDISKDFADSFKTSFIRYHFITDLVPHLPFFIIGYRHIGKSRGLGWHNPSNAHNLDSYLNRIK